MSEEKKVFIPKRVVLVTLLNYHLAPNTQKTYMFSAIEEMKEEDIVFCDTESGLVVGRVLKVYDTVAELLADKTFIRKDIKPCRKYIGYYYLDNENVPLDADLPFWLGGSKTWR